METLIPDLDPAPEPRRFPVVPIPDPADPEFWEKLAVHLKDARWRRNMALGQWARRERERIREHAAEVLATLDFQIRQTRLF